MRQGSGHRPAAHLKIFPVRSRPQKHKKPRDRETLPDTGGLLPRILLHPGPSERHGGMTAKNKQRFLSAFPEKGRLFLFFMASYGKTFHHPLTYNGMKHYYTKRHSHGKSKKPVLQRGKNRTPSARMPGRRKIRRPKNAGATAGSGRRRYGTEKKKRFPMLYVTCHVIGKRYNEPVTDQASPENAPHARSRTKKAEG